ncbi:VOC family protein [Euzebya sp.]|uniref:VOC family protein n=1 Tax=Euzebya sp. TaxID=1971409 RepID=UPI0035198EAC
MPRLDAIGLVAADLAATLRFYRLLGVPFPEEGEGHVEAQLDGGLRLMVDTEAVVQSFSDWTPPAGGTPRTALAFLCDDPADVDATHAAVLDAGFASHVAPFDAPWGQRYATVLDPDGNHVDLFAPLT